MKQDLLSAQTAVLTSLALLNIN